MRSRLFRSVPGALIALGLVLAAPSLSKADFYVQLSDNVGDSITIDGSTATYTTTGTVGVTNTTLSPISGLSPGEINVAGTGGASTGITLGAAGPSQMLIHSIDAITSNTGLTYTTIDATGSSGTLTVTTNSGYIAVTGAATLSSNVTNNSTTSGVTAQLQSWLNLSNLAFISGGPFAVPGGSITPGVSATINPTFTALAPFGTDTKTLAFAPTPLFTLGTKLNVGFSGGSQTANVAVTDIINPPQGTQNPAPAPSSALLAMAGIPVFVVAGWLRRRKTGLAIQSA